jgi:hypothetical protein
LAGTEESNMFKNDIDSLRTLDGLRKIAAESKSKTDKKTEGKFKIRGAGAYSYRSIEKMIQERDSLKDAEQIPETERKIRDLSYLIKHHLDRMGSSKRTRSTYQTEIRGLIEKKLAR